MKMLQDVGLRFVCCNKQFVWVPVLVGMLMSTACLSRQTLYEGPHTLQGPEVSLEKARTEYEQKLRKKDTDH